MPYLPQNQLNEPEKEDFFNFRDFATSLRYNRIPGRPQSKALGSQTIGTTQVTVPHGLSNIPNVIITQMTSTGMIWQSTPADGTNIYLTADAAGRTANITVQYLMDNLR